MAKWEVAKQRRGGKRMTGALSRDVSSTMDFELDRFVFERVLNEGEPILPDL